MEIDQESERPEVIDNGTLIMHDRADLGVWMMDSNSRPTTSDDGRLLDATARWTACDS